MTTLILGASPLTMILLDWVRPGGTRPAPGLWAGFAVGVAGLVLLLGPGALPSGSRPPIAQVAALLFSSVSWWTGSLYSKHSKSGAEPLMAAAIQMVCGGVFMLLAGLAFGEARRLEFASVSSRSWGAFSYLVVAGSLVAYPVYVWLLKHSSPARVSTYAYINPIVAVFLGWAVLEEPLTPRIVVAAAIIVGAVALITTQKHRPPKKS